MEAQKRNKMFCADIGLCLLREREEAACNVCVSVASARAHCPFLELNLELSDPVSLNNRE